MYIYIYVRTEREREQKRARERGTHQQDGDPRKILALPSRHQPAHVVTLRTSHVGWKYAYT